MKSILLELINTLNDGNWHSGNQLAEHFSMTRAGIWKQVQELSKYGIEIEAVKSKGYKLKSRLELLDEHEIVNHLSTINQTTLSDLKILHSTTSTNDELLNSVKDFDERVQVCLAEYQTAGRGRRSRTWHSSFGKNIQMSILWHFESDPGALAGLSLAIGLAVVRALKALGVSKQLGLKWPNDILFNGKKLSGILIELHAEANALTSAIIGIGLNIDLGMELEQDIEHDIIDLKTILNKTIKRNYLIASVLDNTMNILNEYQRYGFSIFIDEWHDFDCYKNQPVKIVTPHSEIHGIARGVNERGLLILEKIDGEVQQFSSGEVSLRVRKNAII